MLPEAILPANPPGLQSVKAYSSAPKKLWKGGKNMCICVI